MTDARTYATTTGSTHPCGAALADILAAATRAADPATQVTRVLRRAGAHVWIDGVVSTPRRVVLLAVGKAAPAMAAAAAHALGDLVGAGLVVYKDPDPRVPPVDGLVYHQAGHPVPDARSCTAGAAALALVAAAKPDELVLVLLSGGGSALLVDLAPGISLAMLQQLTTLLLASGADITAINTVRRRIDRVKGGGLAHAARHTQLRTLILSDVIGNDVAAIASGPTVANPDHPDAALGVLARTGIIDRVDPAIVAACRQPLPVGTVSTPPLIIADIGQALTAAATAARRAGYEPTIVARDLHGDAASAGRHIAEQLAAVPPSPYPRCLLGGGETTVSLPADHGRGGRNQTLALAIAAAFPINEPWLVAAYATDGGDGPTDAAGAVVDATTVDRAAALGYRAAAHLERCDAYPFFAALGDLLRPGPTGTNVNDLVIALCPSSSRLR